MGYYGEYLEQGLTVPQLNVERKRQLRRISELRGGRDVLVYAADMDKPNTPPQWLSIAYGDLLPFNDQLANLRGNRLDLVLETGGGSGEVAEDIVRLLRSKYEEIGIIVPGWAKSAGTIMAMAGDEILMEPASALGPIDAQLAWQGKVFSADALIEGLEKIKKEVVDTGALNRAYIPMLQALSPGELQSAANALEFARRLVTDWLVQYKFRSWTVHSSSGQPVGEAEKKQRAEEIATKLCNHRAWLTHGRSIKIADLEEMRLRIVDYSENGPLAEAIRRYHTLLQMTFDSSNIYKVFETSESQIFRFIAPSAPPPQPSPQTVDFMVIEAACPQCGAGVKIQANLKKSPLQPNHFPFPQDNKFKCPSCGAEIDLTSVRGQIEVQSKRAIIPEYE